MCNKHVIEKLGIVRRKRDNESEFANRSLTCDEIDCNFSVYLL